MVVKKLDGSFDNNGLTKNHSWMHKTNFKSSLETFFGIPQIILCLFHCSLRYIKTKLERNKVLLYKFADRIASFDGIAIRLLPNCLDVFLENIQQLRK